PRTTPRPRARRRARSSRAPPRRWRGGAADRVARGRARPGPSGCSWFWYFTRAVTVLRLDGVSKLFGETAAVDRVSLEIARGEIFTLLGPSGCGKTTTLRLVAGLDRPDA